MESTTNQQEEWIAQLRSGKQLSQRNVQRLCLRAKEIFRLEPNVKSLAGPITICGDVRGQFYDLLEVFGVGGDVPSTNFLFLGNYVHRGGTSSGVETLSLLLALKVRYPERVTLLRGSFDNQQITLHYGFYDECMRKYGDSNVWSWLTGLFDYFPLAALIENQIFCVHSGLSPYIDSIDQLHQLDRTDTSSTEGPMVDLLWSEPDDRTGWGLMLSGNSSYTFGEDVSKRFNQENGLSFIVRSHQIVYEGVQWLHDHHVLSIFSAPNTRQCYNEAVFVQFDEHLQPNVVTFDAAPKPGLRSTKWIPAYFSQTTTTTTVTNERDAKLFSVGATMVT